MSRYKRVWLYNRSNLPYAFGRYIHMRLYIRFALYFKKSFSFSHAILLFISIYFFYLSSIILFFFFSLIHSFLPFSITRLCAQNVSDYFFHRKIFFVSLNLLFVSFIWTKLHRCLFSIYFFLCWKKSWKNMP